MKRIIPQFVTVVLIIGCISESHNPIARIDDRIKKVDEAFLRGDITETNRALLIEYEVEQEVRVYLSDIRWALGDLGDVLGHPAMRPNRGGDVKERLSRVQLEQFVRKTSYELSSDGDAHAWLYDVHLIVLARLKWMEELNLGGQHITDAGLKELAKLKNLTILNLVNTQATKAGVAELQKALPKCKIFSNPTK